MRLLLGGLVSGLPEHAMRAIVERAEGVPLYAVETLRMLIDRGVLQPTEDGDRFTLAVDLPELDVPATLQALIAARLDTLAAEDRSLLMDASVLGLSFTVPSLRALTEMDDRGRRGEPRPARPAPAARPRRRPAIAGARPVPVRPGCRPRGRLPGARQAGPSREAHGRGAPSRIARRRRARRRPRQPLPRGLPRDTGGAGGGHAGRSGAGRAAGCRRAGGVTALADRCSWLPRSGDHRDPGSRASRRSCTSAPRDTRRRRRESPKPSSMSTRHNGSSDRSADRLGILRGRALEARIELSEHGDKAAIEILREALDDVADLPPSPEVALAQSELARALMLRGSPEAITWADKVLAELEPRQPRSSSSKRSSRRRPRSSTPVSASRPRWVCAARSSSRTGSAIRWRRFGLVTTSSA